MRNLFLALILANLLFLAWHVWIDPSEPASPVSGPDDLVVFGAGPGQASPGLLGNQSVGTCLQMGPLPSDAAAQQVRERLASRGVDAIPVTRETQQWLGHWVQIDGFSSVAAAETAHQRLISGGLADAYLMQDGAEPLISLGVFRDQSRAERVVETARALGFDAVMRDRYRPAVEQWLLIRPRAGQSLGAADLSIAGDRIMRTEKAACGADSAVSTD
ncbi:MAG: hypothetical protein Q8N51_01925 [Gammaproteobacteria bacterium]|nr:hypothetical protein [Gammaproteobacteria bacterium]